MAVSMDLDSIIRGLWLDAPLPAKRYLIDIWRINEELSGQAQILKNLVGQFRLKTDGTGARGSQPAPAPVHAHTDMSGFGYESGEKY